MARIKSGLLGSERVGQMTVVFCSRAAYTWGMVSANSGLFCIENLGARAMRVYSSKQRNGGFEQSRETAQFEIRQFVFGDAPRMVEIQNVCLEVCRDTLGFTTGFFYEPCFEGGDNIFCAVDGVRVSAS